MIFLARLTIYNFSKRKVKFDYSILPIEKIEDFDSKEKVRFKSATSDEFVEFKSSMDIYNKPLVIRKDDDGNRISRILKVFLVEDGKSLEDYDTYFHKVMYNEFIKHFWYKLSHIRALNKKVRIGQFKIE